MTSETLIAIVTIVCGCVVTVVSLLVRANVIGLKAVVGEQTKQIAQMHQTIIAQSATIFEQAKE